MGVCGIGGQSVTSNLPVISVSCEVMVSSVKDVWVVPYAIDIVYEFSALLISHYRISPLTPNVLPSLARARADTVSL